MGGSDACGARMKLALRVNQRTGLDPGGAMLGLAPAPTWPRLTGRRAPGQRLRSSVPSRAGKPSNPLVANPRAAHRDGEGPAIRLTRCSRRTDLSRLQPRCPRSWTSELGATTIHFCIHTSACVSVALPSLRLSEGGSYATLTPLMRWAPPGAGRGHDGICDRPSRRRRGAVAHDATARTPELSSSNRLLRLSLPSRSRVFPAGDRTPPGPPTRSRRHGDRA